MGATLDVAACVAAAGVSFVALCPFERKCNKKHKHYLFLRWVLTDEYVVGLYADVPLVLPSARGRVLGSVQFGGLAFSVP